MGYYGYYGYVQFDWTYILLLVAAVFAMIASVKVKTTYNKYAKVASRRGLTAEAAATAVLRASGVTDVRIGRISGELTDNFNPKTGTISLSDSVYGKTSVAAIGVACHEAGHAIQHAEQYGPIKIRTAIVPITQIGSTLSMPILLAGFILGFGVLIYVGIALFATSTVFQLVTLPTELNASSRALKALDSCGILEKDELKGAKKVLTAAALTYVAALASSLLTLLRYIMLAKRRDD
ncbi:MAG: zinc metallopeptidase [Clostridia bacterium]|nr:zinc metallopeptidase [Clostridia bacterium]